MSDSYTRNCKNCGRRIHMRKMPHGQWVAFEGYDTVHNCGKPPVQGRYQSSSNQLDDKQSKTNVPLSSKFGFTDFNLEDSRNLTDRERPIAPPNTNIQRNSPREENKNSFSTIIEWIIWIVIIFLIIRFLF